MVEYEYSYKVKNIVPFLNYCEENGYIKKKENMQTRVLFTNGRGMLAKMTTTFQDGKEVVDFNLKDEGNLEQTLNLCRESPKLIVSDTNREFVYSMLDMLEFKKFKELKRKRYVYVKENVKFEIDDYINPVMKVLAIEGEKEEVDKVYRVLSKEIERLKEE